MARAPDGIDPAALTVVARSVLLDALAALEGHRDAIVLVGAQAVYIHTSDADLGVPAYTSDGDLGIDPDRIGGEPLVEQAMAAAGFTRRHDLRDPQPGMWWKPADINGQPTLVEVDLMVPAELAVGSPKKRSVSVPPHDRQALRRVDGLAVAMEDNTRRAIVALDPADTRTADVRVAGVAALLVAKAIKISERLDQPERRRTEKDASDVLRLMSVVRPRVVAQRFDELLTDERVGTAAARGLRELRRLFGAATGPGVGMARQALVGQPSADTAAALAPAFVAHLPDPDA